MWASLGLSSSSNSQAKPGKPGEGLEEAAVLVAKEASGVNSVVSRRTIGAEPVREDATERMRRIERRAAAAQQRSLDKKIAALTEEMAEVEALLNRSLTKRTGEASAIESHREGLKESLSAIESQHQMSTAEIALDLAAKAEREISANSEVNHTVWLQPKESPNSNGLKQAGSGRKVIRASGREGLYDNDKYSARTRGGDIWSSFSIYFGRGGADALPLPVGARTKNMSPSSMGNVILMLSLIVAAVIVYLAVNHWIPVQFGASLHAK